MNHNAKVAALEIFTTHCKPSVAIAASNEPKPTKQAVNYFFDILLEGDMDRPPPPVATTPMAITDEKPTLYDEVSDGSKFRTPQSQFTTYAGMLVKRKSMSGAKAAAEAMAAAVAYGHVDKKSGECSFKINREAARRASKNPGVESAPRGRVPVLPQHDEQALADLVELFRVMKFPCFKSTIMGIVNLYLRAHPELWSSRAFKGGKATDGWYNGWLARYNLTHINQRPLELSRYEWFTSSNCKRYFDIIRDLALRLKGTCCLALTQALTQLLSTANPSNT